MTVSGYLEMRIDRNPEKPCVLNLLYAVTYVQYYFPVFVN